MGKMYFYKFCLTLTEGMLAMFDMLHFVVVLVESSSQELVYKFYKNSIVSYTIITVEEALNLALDTTFPSSYLKLPWLRLKLILIFDER